MTNETQLTVENLNQAFEQALDGRLDDLVTRDDLDAFRQQLHDEVDEKLEQQQQSAKEKLDEEQRLNHDLRNFVTEHMLRFENQNKRAENQNKQVASELKSIREMVQANRELEDTRDNAHRQLAQQTQTTQALANANSAELRRVANEVNDIYPRMLPLTYEVMGNPETAKKSLRAEVSAQHNEMLSEVRKVASVVNTVVERLGVVEMQVQRVQQRHADEDKWLRERPRVIKNALVNVGTNVFASTVVKWAAILFGGTTLGALVIEFIRALFGG